eukprot:TRINITY_DN75498_c0_g1_i1.p1 TRINITY_DN75498_c0_g1~~TRINITY_DN75498_c0_g1_i1.p1  ORF type:complete len:957 (+),score=177.74 TRINITY_DN75498_c0_g1_i1:120-2990(+)
MENEQSTGSTHGCDTLRRGLLNSVQTTFDVSAKIQGALCSDLCNAIDQGFAKASASPKDAVELRVNWQRLQQMLQAIEAEASTAIALEACRGGSKNTQNGEGHVLLDIWRANGTLQVATAEDEVPCERDVNDIVLQPLRVCKEALDTDCIRVEVEACPSKHEGTQKLQLPLEQPTPDVKSNTIIVTPGGVEREQDPAATNGMHGGDHTSSAPDGLVAENAEAQPDTGDLNSAQTAGEDATPKKKKKKVVQVHRPAELRAKAIAEEQAKKEQLREATEDRMDHVDAEPLQPGSDLCPGRCGYTLSGTPGIRSWTRIATQMYDLQTSQVSILKYSWRRASRINSLVQVLRRNLTDGAGSVSNLVLSRPGSGKQVLKSNSFLHNGKRLVYTWADSKWCQRRIPTINPYSKPRLVWDLIGFWFCICDIFLYPLFLFPLSQAFKDDTFSLNIFALVFWTLDIALNCFTGYQKETGAIEGSVMSIIHHYMRSYFLLDLLLLVNDCAKILVSMRNMKLVTALRVAQFLGCLRLLRLIKFRRVYKTAVETVSSELLCELLRLVNLVCGIIVMSHYLACLWYALSPRGDGWKEKFLDSEQHWWYGYTTSMHWALTQFTPASMEVVPGNARERLFACAVIVAAMVIFSSFVSSIQAGMQHLRKLHRDKTWMESQVRTFFAEGKISRETSCRVWRFIKQHNLTSKSLVTVEDISVFSLLPKSIKDDLKVESIAPTLLAHPLFTLYAQIEPGAIRRLCCEAVGALALLPEEELFPHHDLEVNRMAFVIYGKLEYVHDVKEFNERVFVSPGEWACEEALWGAAPMLMGYLVACMGGCEMLTVRAEDFQEVAKCYPASCDFLVSYGEVFIQEFNDASLEEEVTNLLFNDAADAFRVALRAATEYGYNVSTEGGRTLRTMRQSAWRPTSRQNEHSEKSPKPLQQLLQRVSSSSKVSAQSQNSRRSRRSLIN